MVVPWVGFPLGDLLERFAPNSNAKFVAFKTLLDPEQMPGQRRPILRWPYREGLTMAEAMHPLTLMAVGIYGKTLPNQNGAPLRLVIPWKYGFKGIKSIVEIEFTRRQPRTSWNVSAPQEYGFYANVNPEVDHPRWSQARERRIGAGLFAEKQPTLMFNGYAEQVAHLYQGMDLARFSVEGLPGVLIFVGIGTLATVVMQSSHAVLMLTIAALATQQVSYFNALALAIGALRCTPDEALELLQRTKRDPRTREKVVKETLDKAVRIDSPVGYGMLEVNLYGITIHIISLTIAI